MVVVMDVEKETFGTHISQQFNEDLEEIKSHVLAMGGLVEKQVADSVSALVDADSGLASLVRHTEKRVNQYEITVDEECTRILALRQPAASDLRMIVAVTRAITDLERIGDEANKIAKFAVALLEEGESPKGYVEARHIGNHVGAMVRQALDAFARLDVEAALKVAREDKLVDVEYESAMRQLVTYMMEDPRSITRVLNIVWVLRALERIGDHSRNIAEHVIYIVKGKDVRHSNLDEVEDEVLSK